MKAEPSVRENADFDYIVVGSGAGGAPLAAGLAKAGKRVLLIEAGSNQGAKDGAGPAREVTLVPALHGVSTEHEDLSWRYFVKHYENPPHDPDPKWHAGDGEAGSGIFYPRAAALGGCTVHNAMITIAGPASDWDDLADFVGDESWSAQRMRPYFQRLERNQYLPRPSTTPAWWWLRWLDKLRWLVGHERDRTGGGHGFDGWLRTSVTELSLGLRDKQLVKMLKAALRQSKRAGLERSWTLVRRFVHGKIKQHLDPNHAQTLAESPEGLVLIPLAVCGPETPPHHTSDRPFVSRGRRSSPRELLLETQQEHPDRLVIWTDCLVTRVLFADGEVPRAIGVEVLRGRKLYHAHERPSPEAGTPDAAFVKDEQGEVILSGGAFNTPQLLMLSGIGDEESLARVAAASNDPEACVLRDAERRPLSGKDAKLRRIHLPGVGRNLQDRYEVSLVSEMRKPFSLLNGARFRVPDGDAKGDPHLEEWRNEGRGLYTSNGAVLGIFKRSRPDLAQPDLFIFGLPLPFEGYKPGYSKVGDEHAHFTWAILKGHTRNHDGRVELRSTDPRATPKINFHYFNELSGARSRIDDDPDLLALVEGVKFVRGIGKRARFVVRGEKHPGLDLVPEDSDARIKEWVLRDAWGHHACGTCRMGPENDAFAVLDSRFRVRGVEGLRVVDASIFPIIPGYFIVANIYMASEKAVDVILADRQSRRRGTPYYPHELFLQETNALRERRKALHIEDEQEPLLDAGEGERWGEGVTGLGISGGGIRSATLNLGVLQSFSKAGWLRRIDFLSTVSGGSYIGSFLGRSFDRLKNERLLGGDGQPSQAPADAVAKKLESDSREIRWLRKHGNYIAPTGKGDARLNLATFLRNFLSVHFVVGVLLFAAFGVANAVRYVVFDNALIANRFLAIGKGDMPIGHLIESALGPFFSPWFVLCELAILFLVLPRIVGYWIVSQDRHERFQWPPLALLFLSVAILFYIGVHDELSWEPVILGLALLSSLFFVEIAWWRGRLREDAVGTGGVETQRLRTRNYLTYDLGLGLGMAGAALVFALIDTLGHGLHQWRIEANVSYAKAFASFGAVLVAVIPIARKVAGFLAREGQPSDPPTAFQRMLKQQVMAGLLAVVLFTAPLVFYSFAAHAAYQGGSALWIGMATTALALLFSVVLGNPRARAFVNRSSLAQVYAARLSRAYLGASNPLRHRPDGGNVTEVMPGDDVATMQDYRPYETGGPLHLINATVNQTVEFDSQRGNRDRKGEIVAVSPLGMSIGATWHGSWGGPSDAPDAGAGAARKQPLRFQPLGHGPGCEHPLVDQFGRASKRVEMLSLRQWIAISGAAVSPARGQMTELGTALLFGLANLRTGYWWDSGIGETSRRGFPQLTLLRRIVHLLPGMFPTQSLLISEWIARYPGPWKRFWYLSDGGHFENLAGYELIRRRVPRIILCDASCDAGYEFQDLAELMRKVRIDFGAEIEPLADQELDDLAERGLVPAAQRACIGTLAELKPPLDGSKKHGIAEKHAALFRVKYKGGARPSLLLYLKSTLTGDESHDVAQYRAAHAEFPHESTADQFFDEAQWESYRNLGEHMAAKLVGEKGWFWSIPLEGGKS